MIFTRVPSPGQLPKNSDFRYLITKLSEYGCYYLVDNMVKIHFLNETVFFETISLTLYIPMICVIK